MDADKRAAADPAHASAQPAADTLDAYLDARVERLSERLAASGGNAIPDADIREVRLLRELALLSSSRRAAPAKPRSILPGLMALTAACISALVFLRLPTVRIDLDVLCSGLRFRTASPIQLTGLSRLTLLQTNESAPVLVEDPATLAAISIASPLELRPADEGALTLSSISIPAGAFVSILKTADTGTWRLDIEHRDASVSATASGSVMVIGEGATRKMAFGRGSRIDLRANTGNVPHLGLFVTPQRADTMLATTVIPLNDIAFEEPVQEALSADSGIVRGEASSVLAGSVFNVSLGGKELALRKRDTVEFTLESGQLRELRLEQEGLRVSLTAVATELRVGRAGGLQTLRPSYLEWLAQRHGLQLAWGAAAWAFGLLLGGARWWQESNA
jgi:hypothetical protein